MAPDKQGSQFHFLVLHFQAIFRTLHSFIGVAAIYEDPVKQPVSDKLQHILVRYHQQSFYEALCCSSLQPLANPGVPSG